MGAPRSENFSFLAVHDPELERLGSDAERFFARDPDVSLVRLRQLGERIAQRAAALAGVPIPARATQHDVIRRLQDSRLLTPAANQLFHGLRASGNEATHQLRGNHGEALLQLRMARQLGIWFHTTFGTDPAFRAGPFVPPPDPAATLRADAAYVAELRSVRDELLPLKLTDGTQLSLVDGHRGACAGGVAVEMAIAERARHAPRQDGYRPRTRTPTA